MRIGHGYDVHAFEPGNGIVLGGVHIDFDKCFIAHSDGDVLIHALCDALLGAAGLGDIGQHFPDDDEQYKGIESRKLLREVVALLMAEKLSISNADITIVAQAPKMSPHLVAMKANLSADLAISERRINIKATTTEGLGFEGKGDGIAVHAVCLLEE